MTKGKVGYCDIVFLLNAVRYGLQINVWLWTGNNGKIKFLKYKSSFAEIFLSEWFSNI